MQEAGQEARNEEIVANLATGRVYLLVVKDAIIAGVLGVPAEPGALPPQMLESSNGQLAVLFGAVEWRAIDSGKQLASLPRELPSLHPLSNAAAGPHLGQTNTGDLAVGIEKVGTGAFERLRDIAAQLHGRIELAQGQPVLKIILADFAEDYGAEIWTLDYALKQEDLRENYWQTQILRPRYNQVWPPEKGQPHGLIEIMYPPAQSGPSVSELVHASDSGMPAGGNIAAVEQAIQAGDTRKIIPADAIAFFQSALKNLAGGNGNYAVAAIGAHTGFAWIVQPKATEESKKPRPPGAPTLQKP